MQPQKGTLKAKNVIVSRSNTINLSKKMLRVHVEANTLPISGKLLITHLVKQNDVDYQGRLTIENELKVEINYISSKTSTNFPPTKKTLWISVFFIENKVSPAKMACFTKKVTIGGKPWTTQH